MTVKSIEVMDHALEREGAQKELGEGSGNARIALAVKHGVLFGSALLLRADELRRANTLYWPP